MSLQRVVEVVKLLDDPAYTGGETEEVELAIRMVGCGTSRVHLVNHVYWA